MFCRDLHLTFIFAGLLQKDPFKGKVISNKIIVTLVTQGFPRLLPSPVLLRKFANDFF